MDFDFLHELSTPAQTKIVMLVLDGLGGLPLEPGGKTELETARTPNLDALAASSALGLSVPLGPGITVESGPGHLALFGYDPLEYRIGRGVLEAVGLDLDLEPDDLAVRGNYCTVDEAGVVTDRRAGRIPTEISKELSKLLTTMIEDVDIFVETVREHRLAIVLRGSGPERQRQRLGSAQERLRPAAGPRRDPRGRENRPGAEPVHRTVPPGDRSLYPETACQHAACARLRQISAFPGFPRTLRSTRRRHRGLPHLSRHRQTGWHARTEIRWEYVCR